MAVQVEVCPLAHTFKLNEHFALQVFLGQFEVLAIPTDGVGQIDDVLAESLVTVKGVW